MAGQLGGPLFPSLGGPSFLSGLRATDWNDLLTLGRGHAGINRCGLRLPCNATLLTCRPLASSPVVTNVAVWPSVENTTLPV
jgi:hypothetical protein